MTLPSLIPIYFIDGPVWVIIYLICLFIYARIAISFAIKATIMPSLWKELDPEKYDAIISSKPLRLHYTYKLHLYLATGDYQAAYNIISSVMLQSKNVNEKVYGHLTLCRIYFERGDYEGLKENIEQIDNYYKYTPNIKISKLNKEAYEIYRKFSDADYVSVSALLEKSIEKYSEKKSRTYFAIMRQYQLAVTKRINGDIEEAVTLFEAIKEKAPKLAFASLAQKQLDLISGTLEEEASNKLEMTEHYNVNAHVKARRTALIIICIGCILCIVGKSLMQLDTPKQENKDLDFIANLEVSIKDDYESSQILGYFNIYADESIFNKDYSFVADSLFLVKSNEGLDLHSISILNGEYQNHLNVKDIRVDTIYVYETHFLSYKVEFVLTEKKRNIPDNTQYYYEIDGYYFCVISVLDQ